MIEVGLKIVDIIQDLCGLYVDDISITLSDDLGLDSLKIVMLLIMLEEEFNIEFDKSDMNPRNLITVNDIIELCCEYLYEYSKI